MQATNGRTYRYFEGQVLYPFGYGLSYSEFNYTQHYEDSNLGTYSPCQSIDISVDLALIAGPSPADEVVQLYVALMNASVPTPLRSLVSFTRHVFSTGPRQTVVKFRMLPEDHAVLRKGDFVPTVEPGMRTVWVGGGQPGTGAAGVALIFYVRGAATTVATCAAQKGGAKRAAGEWQSGNPDAHLWSP
jgi:beta-glucosidase